VVEGERERENCGYGEYDERNVCECLPDEPHEVLYALLWDDVGAVKLATLLQAFGGGVQT